MAFIYDAAYDAALAAMRADVTTVTLCSSEPANYAAIAGVTLGTKSGVTLTASADDPVNGRRATVATFTDGAVTASGTATHYAFHDGAGTLVATTALATPTAVVNGGTWGLSAAAVFRFPDGVAA